MRVVLGLLLVVTFSGCGGSELPDREPDVTGVIGGWDGVRRLVENPAQPFECPSLIGRDEETVVLRAANGGYEAIAWNELRAGNRAEVWLDGEMTASCPSLGHADVFVMRGVD